MNGSIPRRRPVQAASPGDAIENPALDLRSVVLLMQRYPEDFFYAPIIPPALQRAIARPLARRAGPH